MYRYIRTATLKNASYVPQVTSFGIELTGYLNKTYGLNLQCGMEMFDGCRMHWHFDTDSVEKITDLNMKLMQDKTYWSMLERMKDVWTDGQLKDTVVMFPKM